MGRRRRAARSSRWSTSGRCSTASAAGRVVETRELAADEWVDIPSGVAHGFLALDPLELIYLVTNEYDGTDELGFAWDDPAVGVAWPTVAGTPAGRPIVSDRDATNPPLADCVVRLRDQRDSDRTPQPAHPAPLYTAAHSPEGASGSGTIPR